jgi:T-complex protein 1 subunit beta
MAMSNKVDEAARTVKGKKALAVEAFSRALRQVCYFLIRVRMIY